MTFRWPLTQITVFRITCRALVVCNPVFPGRCLGISQNLLSTAQTESYNHETLVTPHLRPRDNTKRDIALQGHICHMSIMKVKRTNHNSRPNIKYHSLRGVVSMKERKKERKKQTNMFTSPVFNFTNHAEESHTPEHTLHSLKCVKPINLCCLLFHSYMHILKHM